MNDAINKYISKSKGCALMASPKEVLANTQTRIGLLKMLNSF